MKEDGFICLASIIMAGFLEQRKKAPCAPLKSAMH